MARINVKLDDVESGFVVIPEDSYLVELQETSSVKKAKTSGEPKITWISKILEGDYEGKVFSWDTSLVAAALWNLKSMLEALELEWDEDGFDLEDCTYRKIIVEVVVEDYEGDARNYVRGYRKA